MVEETKTPNFKITVGSFRTAIGTKTLCPRSSAETRAHPQRPTPSALSCGFAPAFLHGKNPGIVGFSSIGAEWNGQ